MRSMKVTIRLESGNDKSVSRVVNVQVPDAVNMRHFIGYLTDATINQARSVRDAFPEEDVTLVEANDDDTGVEA